MPKTTTTSRPPKSERAEPSESSSTSGRTGIARAIIAALGTSAVLVGGLAATAVGVRRQAEIDATASRSLMIRRVGAAVLGAAAIALAVRGLRRLAGARSANKASEDAELHGRIDHELINMGIPAGRFAIDVEDGAVTVRGAPQSNEQTRLVERLLGKLDGVREVTIDVLPVPA